jgi:hypothetical protein
MVKQNHGRETIHLARSSNAASAGEVSSTGNRGREREEEEAKDEEGRKAGDGGNEQPRKESRERAQLALSKLSDTAKDALLAIQQVSGPPSRSPSCHPIHLFNTRCSVLLRSRPGVIQRALRRSCSGDAHHHHLTSPKTLMSART